MHLCSAITDKHVIEEILPSMINQTISVGIDKTTSLNKLYNNRIKPACIMCMLHNMHCHHPALPKDTAKLVITKLRANTETDVFPN